jgi:hypothetical protein
MWVTRPFGPPMPQISLTSVVARERTHDSLTCQVEIGRVTKGERMWALRVTLSLSRCPENAFRQDGLAHDRASAQGQTGPSAV